MRSLFAFMKKEWMEQCRSGRLMILGMLFILFGIMNPAVAKLTPWLFQAMADSLAESGITVTSVTVSAMDSWVQFFKNIPIGLIVFILLQSSIFTREYQTGTLVLVLTKGIERYKVAASKAAGFDNLKGHKSVGGLRASIYNAMPKEGVEALVEFLKKYEQEHA